MSHVRHRDSAAGHCPRQVWRLAGWLQKISGTRAARPRPQHPGYDATWGLAGPGRIARRHRPEPVGQHQPAGRGSERRATIPLAFSISFVAVLLLSYSFVRLSQHFNTAGSVFGFVGATLGAPAGAIAGWCLLGGYLIFGAGSCFGAAVFRRAAFHAVGLQPGQGNQQLQPVLRRCLRHPGLHRLRGRGDHGRGGQAAAQEHPAGDLRHRADRGRVLTCSPRPSR